MSIETDDNEETPVDERPQGRREWSGAMRSIVLPVLVVGAIVAAIWLIEQRDGGASGGGNTGIVDRPSGSIRAGQEVAAERGKVAPDFVLDTVDGGSVRLSDFAGRPVFVNFWATWCTPCRKEMPEIIAARERYAESGLEVIAINALED